MQLGFGDGWISSKVGQNATLERLSAEVRWYRFEKLLGRLRPEGAGRPPYEPLMMLKALLLQQWYGLSDAALEEAINDRVSFRRFLGLPLEGAAPDHTTLCRFRQRLVQEGLSEKLFAEFETQLQARGLILRQGTMIDASLVATPHRPPPAEGGRAAVDPDARLTARKGMDIRTALTHMVDLPMDIIYTQLGRRPWIMGKERIVLTSEEIARLAGVELAND